jgi:hypothetical protein
LSRFVASIFCGAACSFAPRDATHLFERYQATQESLLHSTLLRAPKINSQEKTKHLSSELFNTLEFDMATIKSATKDYLKIALFANAKPMRTRKNIPRPQVKTLVGKRSFVRLPLPLIRSSLDIWPCTGFCELRKEARSNLHPAVAQTSVREKLTP